MELRYMGFEQDRNKRTYRFEGVARGEPTMHYVVTADMGLFLEHRIAIQEGPSLCARKLASDLESPGHNGHALTTEDFRAHANARAIAEARKAESRRGAPRRRPAN